MRRGVRFSNLCVVGAEVAHVFFGCCARTGGSRSGARGAAPAPLSLPHSSIRAHKVHAAPTHSLRTPTTLFHTHSLPSTEPYRPRTLSKWTRSEHACSTPSALPYPCTLHRAPVLAEDPVSRQLQNHDSKNTHCRQSAHTTRAPPSLHRAPQGEPARDLAR